MGLYARYLVPKLTQLAMSQRQLHPYREHVVSEARGRVLEMGIGSGLNLPLYGDAVEEVIGVDPSREILALARDATEAVPRTLKVHLLGCAAERLPPSIQDASIETVVVSWALSRTPNPVAALAESRR